MVVQLERGACSYGSVLASDLCYPECLNLHPPLACFCLPLPVFSYLKRLPCAPQAQLVRCNARRGPVRRGPPRERRARGRHPRLARGPSGEKAVEVWKDGGGTVTMGLVERLDMGVTIRV